MPQDDQPEILDLGVVDEPGEEAGAPPPRRPRVSRRGLLVLAGAAALAGGYATVRSRGQPAAEPSPRPTPSPSPSPTASVSATTAPVPETDAVVVTELGHPLLAGQSLDVVGLGPGYLVRVDVPTGRVLRVRLPAELDGNLSVVPVRGATLLRRSDDGRGYMVRDDGTLDDLPAALVGFGPLLPGPDLDHVWLMLTSSRPSFALVSVDGRRTQVGAELPAYMSSDPIDDGAGYPLLFGVGGAYSVGIGGLRRVTDGAVIARGRYGWLAIECDDRDRCSGILIARTGARRPVLGLADPLIVVGGYAPPTGALAPDARRAALYYRSEGSELRLGVLDLVSGDVRFTEFGLDPGASQGGLAWSPDGRCLFTVDASARIIAIDARTLRGEPLVPGSVVPAVPVVDQLALRPAA
jgi:hypothetical protein